MKRVGIFHDEFAGPHDTKPRPDFIAKLGLYLEQVDGSCL